MPLTTEQLQDFDQWDPAAKVSKDESQGTIDQRINWAALSYAYICTLEFGYEPDMAEVAELIRQRLEERGQPMGVVE